MPKSKGKGKRSRTSSPSSSPPPPQEAPIKERELVPYFTSGDPDAAVNECLLPPVPTRKQTRRTSPNSNTPSNNNKHTGAVKKDVKMLKPGHNYAGPAFTNSPAPNELPDPLLLLGSLTNPDPVTSPTTDQTGAKRKTKLKNKKAKAADTTLPASFGQSTPPQSTLPMDCQAESKRLMQMLGATPTLSMIQPANPVVDPSAHLKSLLKIQPVA